MPERVTGGNWPKASQRQLAAWRKLLTKKGRREAGQILIEGIRQVSEAIASGSDISAIIIAADTRGESALKRLQGFIPKLNAPVLTLPARDFDKLTDTVHSSGIASVMAWAHHAFDDSQRQRNYAKVLVCDRIADPGNLGTLIRTAAGLGVDAVFMLAGTAELTNPKTIRSTAGTIFRIPVFEEVSADAVVHWARQHKSHILVADAHRGSPLIPDKIPSRWILVVGSETLLLSPEWESAATTWIRLTLARGVESLNAAVAGAIILDRLCRGR